MTILIKLNFYLLTQPLRVGGGGRESAGKIFATMLMFFCYYAPTFKKLKGHIALGLSIGPSVCSFV